MGGNVLLSDYCPRATEYSNGDCSDTANADTARPESGGQVGQQARCFMSSLASGWSSGGSGSPLHATCYRRTCKADALLIHVGNTGTVSCPVRGRGREGLGFRV